MVFRLLVATTLCLLLHACGEVADPVPPNLAELRAQEPLSESYNVDYRYTDSAKLKTRLRAPYDVEHVDPMDSTPKGQPPATVHHMDRGLLLEFFNTNTGKLESSIKANQGELYQKRGLAVARGNVIVQNVKGETLQTEELTWSRERDEIYTDKDVRIQTEREVLFGKGLVSNTSFTKYRILRLKGTLALEE